MARLSAMVRDRKTGRSRRKDPARVRAGKKAAKARKGKHLTAATRRKIGKSVTRATKTHRTRAGRRTITVKRAATRTSTRKVAKGRPGRKPGFSHSAATRKKMSKSHRARWARNGAKYRKARKSRR